MFSVCLKCSDQQWLSAYNSNWPQRSNHPTRLKVTSFTTEYLELVSIMGCLCIPRSGIAEHWSWSQTPSTLCQWLSTWACSLSESRNQTKTLCHLAKTPNSTLNLMTFGTSDPSGKSFTYTWKEFLGGEHPVPYAHAKSEIVLVFLPMSSQPHWREPLWSDCIIKVVKTSSRP